MSLCPSNQLKSPILIEIETVFELSTNAKSMVIKLFHNTWEWMRQLFFFKTLFVIAGKEKHISNNIQKIYNLFAGAYESKYILLRALSYEGYELKLLSIIYDSPCASSLHSGRKKT